MVQNVDKSWVMHACGDKEIDENNITIYDINKLIWVEHNQ